MFVLMFTAFGGSCRAVLVQLYRETVSFILQPIIYSTQSIFVNIGVVSRGLGIFASTEIRRGRFSRERVLAGNIVCIFAVFFPGEYHVKGLLLYAGQQSLPSPAFSLATSQTVFRLNLID